ncbi:NAD(P)-dependent oxidoreductase [Pseudorhizobium endolithicum]|uniref:NAD(P)-dependent oxidoreductase n=1 Tax=Pseudorhizobium endolithicum TaxID=1191678 RepID=A0ABN7JYT0_9HYPH|nr:NAD(P)-dependent oxidoreductase [Pseudorhizobium endolithicum]CAD7050103.1 NAD(P)-dependent oxidoreductase [Pseudorhizobium endolithicum]
MADTAAEYPKIAFVGFGEAGHAIAGGWEPSPMPRVCAYDVKLRDETAAGPVLRRCADAGVEAIRDPNEALAEAGVIFSLVTADQALEAARSVASHLAPGAYWLDCNSCAPQTKQKAAEVIEAAGARYVDVAVMAPVYPKRHQVPLLLAGPHAEEAARLLERLDMRPKITGTKIGDASSVKMLRSVIIKGLEALTAECLLAARRAGVEDAVLASLQASDPGIDWRARGAYNLERMMVHGARRAAEVEEVCVTLREFGLPDWMSSGTVEWQRAISDLGLDPGENDLARRSDMVLRSL